jgi:hypothetical protein
VYRPLHLATLLASVACADEERRPRVDADLYIEQFCEEDLEKQAECAPLSEHVIPWAEFDECVEDWSARAEEEPCFAETAEFVRCMRERESCEEYLDLGIATHPGSLCHAVAVVLRECVGEHIDYYDTDGETS